MLHLFIHIALILLALYVVSNIFDLLMLTFSIPLKIMAPISVALFFPTLVASIIFKGMMRPIFDKIVGQLPEETLENDARQPFVQRVTMLLLVLSNVCLAASISITYYLWQARGEVVDFIASDIVYILLASYVLSRALFSISMIFPLLWIIFLPLGYVLYYPTIIAERLFYPLVFGVGEKYFGLQRSGTVSNLSYREAMGLIGKIHRLQVGMTVLCNLLLGIALDMLWFLAKQSIQHF